ncbi:hypothetical protein CDAR_516531 [Caerostris darwini]|uniref:Cytochrome c oxidase subunit 1 n=1 Tax=Caerostris darwini TaxID=1538125 RepID=A0AAV4WZ70_9ARAC|nr:hypothetical protein CDAR_516531 [Caerostris darwini]
MNHYRPSPAGKLSKVPTGTGFISTLITFSVAEQGSPCRNTPKVSPVMATAMKSVTAIDMVRISFHMHYLLVSIHGPPHYVSGSLFDIVALLNDL